MKVGDLEHFKNMSFLAHSARGALRIVILYTGSILGKYVVNTLPLLAVRFTATPLLLLHKHDRTLVLILEISTPLLLHTKSCKRSSMSPS